MYRVRRNRGVRCTFMAILMALGLLAGTGAQPAQVGAASTGTDAEVLEAETMSLPGYAGRTVDEAGASGDSTLLVWSNGAADGELSVDRWASELVVTARADLCDGGPRMEVSVGGEVVGTKVVSSTTFRAHRFPVELGAGTHAVSVRFTNDRLTSTCDRNLRLDHVEFLQRSSTNPLDARPFHVGWVPAADAADEIRQGRPADAERLDRLADTPTARWFGEWSGDIQSAAHRFVSEAEQAGSLPVLVAYAIPNRDCGSYSAGGMTPARYREWIRDLAAGVSDRPAAVVLEPDALALVDCLSAVDRAVRNDLLTDAVEVLASGARTAVYLDAGNAGWVPAAEMAERLRAAGVERARGVSLNVSNFGTTAEQTAYAQKLADRLGVHAVIDTSRNGNGSDGTWCNPPGRAIGTAPSTATETAVVDAILWVKVPGESDGSCNGGPPAGEFWVDYAVDLVRNAGS